jgi:ABC-2 type transport system permease protein
MENSPPVQPAQPYGEIYDLGYRHYDGQRLGRAHAIQALVIYSIKRGLGIKKKWTSKIIPFVLYAAAFAPAVIVAGILAFLPDEVDFGYADLYGFIQIVLLIFAAALAPEMLCDDRRENVLGLYFSRALTRLDYLLAKVGAMAVLMGTIAFGPPLLLFAAKTLLDDNPLSYFGDHAGDLGRIALSGTLIAIYYAAIGLAVAAYTDRKGVATAIIIGGIFFATAIANALFEALEGTLRRYVVLFSPLDVIVGVNDWIFGGVGDSETMVVESNQPGVVYAAAILAVAGIAAAIMYRRYLADT